MGVALEPVDALVYSLSAGVDCGDGRHANSSEKRVLILYRMVG